MEHCVKVSSNSDKNCRRRSILSENHDVTIMTSSGHVTSSYHAQSKAHRQVPIGCPLEPSRYLASFPRYLAPKWRHRLFLDDVISDVISPGSTIREDHHIVEHCVKVSSNSDKNCRRRSILNENHDVTIMTSYGHVTSSGACAIDSP